MSKNCGRGLCVVLLAVSCLAGAAWADGTLTGHAWVEKVKGRASGYVPLYEWNIFASADASATTGSSFRVGLPPNPEQSFYTFTKPGGYYSLFLDQPLFWGRPSVIPDVLIPGSGSTVLDVTLPTDYSCAFGAGSDAEWGTNPWTAFASTWYQTFIATGTSVNGVEFKLAGTNATAMLVSVHQDNGGAITTWPQVGISRVKNGIGPTSDMWVRFRSGMIPTTPGVRYALKLTGQNGSPNNEFAIYRRLEDGQGYASGQAYSAAGQAQNLDLYSIIFSDNDGMVMSYAAQEYDPGELAGWDNVWTQQIKAMGNSLAGATLYFAGGDTWDKEFTFKIRSGSVLGPRVGPIKIGRSAIQAYTNGHVAVSYSPGEVPLIPGETYYIEAYQAYGFNPLRFTSVISAYPDGYPFKNGVAQPGVDLHMQVVEYAGAAIDPVPVLEDYEAVPVWTSTYDATWGSAATWSIVAGGQSGNAMQVARTSGGSSNKAMTYLVEPGADYNLSLFLKCPSYAGTYWNEFAYKVGYHTAESFDSDPASWTMIKKFSNDTENGNGNVWTQYTASFNTGGYRQVTVVYKAGSSASAGPSVGIDTLWVSTGPAAPTIARSPATLAPACVQGQNATNQTFTVQNTGGGTLNYSISDNQTWLSCSPASGTSTGEADIITVSYATSGVTAGTHNATITISDPAATNNPQTIAVTLTVSPPPPTITRSPATLAPSCTQGSNASNQTFTVQNTGGGTLSYSISDNQTWLACTPASGTSTGEADTITVSYTTSGLSAGTYNATITISDPNATNNPQTIAVTLTVNPAKLTMAEDFESVPSWTSSFDAAWGNAATWSSVTGGQAGNCLQATRSNTGSSAKVKVYNISPNQSYTISVYMRCPSSTANYWRECFYKLGSYTAQDYDANAGTWTEVKKFSKTGTNGNNNTWVQYSKTFNSGSNTQISVGFKTGNSSGTAPTIKWDTLRIQ